jgi:hypothetical protein
VDWIRLAAVGGPALILTLSQILYFLTPLGKMLFPLLPRWGMAKDGVIVGGVILGYTLISSLNKIDTTDDV